VTVMMVVAGSLGPLPYAFPLLSLWTLAGALRARDELRGSSGFACRA
jgi:hypothetical protein